MRVNWNKRPCWFFQKAAFFGALMLGIILSGEAIASCWRVGDFAGYGARSDSSYRIEPDGFSNQTSLLTISGGISSIRMANGQSFEGIRCERLNSFSILCSGGRGDSISLETWSVDVTQSRAFHTKIINGYGTFDGARVFVGRIIGRC